ncbi:MAG: DUF58 domain-containing protein [bacterium]
MKMRARKGAGLWRRLRNPPIGYQEGRRARFIRNFPMVCWLYYGLTAHTTLRLYMIGAVGVGPTALLMLVGFENPLSLVGFAVLAWVTACMAAGWVWRPRLSVETQMPTRVECDSRFMTRYTVSNRGRRTARDLGIDTLIFSDWLSLRRQRVWLDELLPGETETVSGAGHALARGVYVLPALRYDSGFPCGFWRWGHTGPVERKLFVFPRYARLETLDIPLGNRHRQDLSHARELARAALEFHGCREFRDGDALRHVHPRSSARVGAPVVKEFQAEGRSRTAILVDTRHSPFAERLRGRLWRDDLMEAALSLTAAIIDSLSVTDRVLELLVAGPEVYRFRSAGRVGYLEEVLDILAAVEPCRSDPLDRLEPLLFEEIRAIQSICLILTGWDARREALVREINAWEIGVKVVLIVAHGRQAAGLPPEVVCVSARDVLRGEVRGL